MSNILPAPSRDFIRASANMPPIGFAARQIPREHYQFIESEALEVFTRMVNSGKTFQAALVAVYLTGVNDAMESKQ